MRQRIFDISPETLVIEKPFFYAPDNREEFFEEKIDYIIDAIDSLDSKIDLIKTAKEKNISIISAMGTGNKFHPEKFMISDLSKTKVCPLARRLRRALKEEGITHLKVVYSEEEPKKVLFSPNKEGERTPPGSLSFVPPVAGFLLASAVIRDLINKEF